MIHLNLDVVEDEILLKFIYWIFSNDKFVRIINIFIKFWFTKVLKSEKFIRHVP